MFNHKPKAKLFDFASPKGCRRSFTNGRLRSHAANRNGQALVEFAIISFVLTAMLAGFVGLIVLGLNSFQSNMAAESAGRLLDQHKQFTEDNFNDHFSSNAAFTGFENVTADQMYDFMSKFQFTEGSTTTTLYDESLLIISRADWNQRNTLVVPPVNRMLLGQYIFDPDLDAYRYPGAVVQNTSTNQQTVLIPILDYLNNTTGETATGINRTFNVYSSNSADCFPVASNWVAPVTITRVSSSGSTLPNFNVVIFVPSQPGSMLDLEIVRDSNGRIVSQTPVSADDSALSMELGTLPSGYTFDTPSVIPGGIASTSRGQFGLGETFAFVQSVRPYRRVFESASLFRLVPTDD